MIKNFKDYLFKKPVFNKCTNDDFNKTHTCKTRKKTKKLYRYSNPISLYETNQVLKTSNTILTKYW